MWIVRFIDAHTYLRSAGPTRKKYLKMSYYLFSTLILGPAKMKSMATEKYNINTEGDSQ